ncbi:hypothetical protein PILCRDRAFT_129437 [Piloderma croceum F 1598]|uniref:Uncharacterized protein n=1 Tax=Piloderma croceum (strain F 1598) TaxID=765440 RepID=A0A0C3G587_PILCF|nr:hypothetical protein PILCRDRAFT_129437 [Piloderma croceum F 1598]
MWCDMMASAGLGMGYLQAGSLCPIAMGNYKMFQGRTKRANGSHFPGDTTSEFRPPSRYYTAAIVTQQQDNPSTRVAIVHLSFLYHHLPRFYF